MGFDPTLEGSLAALGLDPGEELFRETPRPLDQIQVAHGIDRPEVRKPVLGRAEQFPGTAQFQVLLRELLTVLDPGKDLEPLPRDLSGSLAQEQHAPARA